MWDKIKQVLRWLHLMKKQQQRPPEKEKPSASGR